MKLNRIGRATAASFLSLAACLGFTACNRDYTVAFLYVTSAQGLASNPHGSISQYGIDFQTGSLISLSSSGQDTGGRNPVALAVTANQKNLYVVNRDDSNIGEFAIGTDGKLYPEKVTTVAGSFPTAIAISPDSAYLYVTFTFQPGFNYSTISPGPGGLQIFKLTPAPDNSQAGSGIIAIGAAVNNPATGLNYFPLGFAPVSLAVGPNRLTNGGSPANSSTCTTAPANCSSYVYVADQDPNPSNLNNLLVFNRDIPSGVITPIGPTTIGTGTASSTGYLSGTQASAIAVTPVGNFVYVTDRLANQILAYGVGNGGLLTPLTSGPFATQVTPVAITIDPRGKFAYVANFNSGSVSPYAIDQASGSLSASGTAALIQGAGPSCVTIENALGIYLYTANFIDGTVSGQQLDSNTGNLVKIRNSPFTSAAQATCAAAVANGTHATQLIQ